MKSFKVTLTDDYKFFVEYEDFTTVEDVEATLMYEGLPVRSVEEVDDE